MENRYCRKCLLDKVFEEDEYRNMQEYISNIDIWRKNINAQNKNCMHHGTKHR